MTGADKVVCHAATLLLLFTLTSMPAKAQFGGGGGGGQDMMTQMAPMLEMMKAKMGKRRFAMMMQTMGPMMSRMMEGGGGGLGGGLGGWWAWRHDGRRRNSRRHGGGYVPEGYGVSTGGMNFGSMGGGDFTGMLGSRGGGELMSMVPQLMRIANVGGGRHGRRHRGGNASARQPSLRRRATKNPSRHRVMDCFASLAMTSITTAPAAQRARAASVPSGSTSR